MEWWQKVIRFLRKKLGFGRKSKVSTSSISDLAQQLIDSITTDTPILPLEVDEPVEFPLPELLAEFQHNHRIVMEFSGDNFSPLQTEIWDAHIYSVQKLPANLREQLKQLYADMHSLNTVVWFITELGSKSSFLEEEYRTLLGDIAKQLHKIESDINVLKALRQSLQKP